MCLVCKGVLQPIQTGQNNALFFDCSKETEYVLCAKSVKGSICQTTTQKIFYNLGCYSTSHKLIQCGSRLFALYCPYVVRNGTNQTNLN